MKIFFIGFVIASMLFSTSACFRIEERDGTEYAYKSITIPRNAITQLNFYSDSRDAMVLASGGGHSADTHFNPGPYKFVAPCPDRPAMFTQSCPKPSSSLDFEMVEPDPSGYNDLATILVYAREIYDLATPTESQLDALVAIYEPLTFLDEQEPWRSVHSNPSFTQRLSNVNGRLQRFRSNDDRQTSSEPEVEQEPEAEDEQQECNPNSPPGSFGAC